MFLCYKALEIYYHLLHKNTLLEQALLLVSLEDNNIQDCIYLYLLVYHFLHRKMYLQYTFKLLED